jgi:hypothetical protein
VSLQKEWQSAEEREAGLSTFFTLRATSPASFQWHWDSHVTKSEQFYARTT